MKVSTSNSLNFKSIKNPVKPFIIKTKLGDLSCVEIPSKELYRSKKLHELSHFLCKNFASLTADPYWLKYNNPKYKEDFAWDFLNYLNNNIREDDGNLTMLVATDKNNKIQAACLSYAYYSLPKASKNVCYVDSLAVNEKYRNNGIAKKLLDKTEEINKKTFTDIFLTGEILAKGFYEKLGFSELDKNDSGQRFVIDLLDYERGDEMDYLIPFNKPIQENKPRWYTLFENISKIK